ncbi:hypothetical protein [Bradyrhizobium sp. JR3.5]
MAAATEKYFDPLQPPNEIRIRSSGLCCFNSASWAKLPTVAVLRGWLRERQGQASDPVFPTTRGHALGHDGLEYLLNKHMVVARRHCPSLNKKRITPHTH